MAISCGIVLANAGKHQWSPLAMLMEKLQVSWLLSLAVAISAAFFTYFLATIRTKSKRSRRRPYSLPPGPAPLPIFGNMFLLSDKPHRDLTDLSRVHGSPVILVKLGRTSVVTVSTPDTAREALQQKDQQVSDRFVSDSTRILGYAETSVPFQEPAGPLWRRLRSVCAASILNTKSVEATRPIRRQKIRALADYFHEHAGSAVDFSDLAFGTTMNIITNIAFSMDMVNLEDGSSHKFERLVSTINKLIGEPNLSDYFPVLRFLDLQGRRRDMGRLLTELFAIIDGLVDARLAGSTDAARTESKRGDLLDYVLDQKLDRQTIRTLFADVLIGGSDTSSISLTWAMAELLRNPAVIDKARAELEAAIGSQSCEDVVDESDLPKLPYLQAIVKEVLRLHPPGPLLIPRKVSEEGVELGGYAVPQGAQLLVNVWSIGRDERYWKDPLLFRPERFLEREIEFKGPDFLLLAFGSGRRSCPGMLMARRTIHLTMATLLREFEWRLPDGMKPEDVDMTEKLGFVLSMANPPRVVALPVRRRRSKPQCQQTSQFLPIDHFCD